jgi:hypothetical protein
MLKLFRIKPYKNNKSCGISLPESNKIGLAFFWIFYNFLGIFYCSGPSQENLDRIHYNQVLNFTHDTLERFQTEQLGPWPGRAARLRPNPGEPAALPAGQAAGLDGVLT